MNTSFEVVVVGGGPVGLWLACELRLAGLSVVVLERRTKRVEQSRALTIHGRTLEVLSLRGIEDRFLATGKPITAGHYAVLDTRLDFNIFDSRFPYTLFIPQKATEEIIEQRALELGVDIRRGAVVEGMTVDSGSVSVRGAGPEGAFELTGAYVVGTDGARSIVRREAGIDFVGHPATAMALMGDVVLGAPPSVPLFSEFNERGSVMVAPLGDGRHYRIVLNEAVDRGVTRDDPVTFEELTSVTRMIAGTDFSARDPLWLSRFDNESRLASHYRRGRIFLAGDAAHIHLPAGGQGMNVGIQDAMNLGWKLAAVVKGEAPECLLDTYERERRPVGVYLHDTTMAQGYLITGFSPHGRALRGVFNDMLKNPEINAYFARQVSGFGVRYPEALPGCAGSSSSLLGNRIRDTELQLKNGERTNLYSLLSAGKWVHLAFDAGAQVVIPEWLPTDAVIFEEVRGVEHASMFSGLKAILIRPDGYVAQSAEERHVDAA